MVKSPFQRLYKRVDRAFERMSESGLDYMVDGRVDFVEGQKGGHNLHILAEYQHMAREGVDYVHKNLLRGMIRHPKSWLFLMEEVGEIHSLQTSPGGFYLKGLAKQLRIPLEEALTSIYSPDTRAFISEQNGVTERDIDLGIVQYAMREMQPPTRLEEVEDYVQQMAKNLMKPFEYARELIIDESSQISWEEDIGTYWNDYSKLHFSRMLEKYPDRTNVLINVGAGHLPVFE